jgi:hypothetical protein
LVLAAALPGLCVVGAAMFAGFVDSAGLVPVGSRTKRGGALKRSEDPSVDNVGRSFGSLPTPGCCREGPSGGAGRSTSFPGDTDAVRRIEARLARFPMGGVDDTSDAAAGFTFTPSASNAAGVRKGLLMSLLSGGRCTDNALVTRAVTAESCVGRGSDAVRWKEENTPEVRRASSARFPVPLTPLTTTTDGWRKGAP